MTCILKSRFKYDEGPYLWCNISNAPSNKVNEEIIIGTITYRPASVWCFSISSGKEMQFTQFRSLRKKYRSVPKIIVDFFLISS